MRLTRGAGGAVRVEGVMCSAPLWFRWDGVTLWQVGSGAAPVGEDHIRVRVEVGPGVAVTVRSVAATVIYAARGRGTRWDTEIHVAEGAHLDWRPEPVISTARSRHASTTTIHAAAGASVILDEVLVGGRSGEAAGSLRSTLDVRVDGDHVLLTSIDSSLPGWSGPGGIDDEAVVSHRLRLGGSADGSGRSSQRGGALLHPAPGCELAISIARDVAAGRRGLDALIPV